MKQSLLALGLLSLLTIFSGVSGAQRKTAKEQKGATKTAETERKQQEKQEKEERKALRKAERELKQMADEEAGAATSASGGASSASAAGADAAGGNHRHPASHDLERAIFVMSPTPRSPASKAGSEDDERERQLVSHVCPPPPLQSLMRSKSPSSRVEEEDTPLGCSSRPVQAVPSSLGCEQLPSVPTRNVSRGGEQLLVGSSSAAGVGQSIYPSLPSPRSQSAAELAALRAELAAQRELSAVQQRGLQEQQEQLKALMMRLLDAPARTVVPAAAVSQPLAAGPLALEGDEHLGGGFIDCATLAGDDDDFLPQSPRTAVGAAPASVSSWGGYSLSGITGALCTVVEQRTRELRMNGLQGQAAYLRQALEAGTLLPTELLTRIEEAGRQGKDPRDVAPLQVLFAVCRGAQTVESELARANAATQNLRATEKADRRMYELAIGYAMRTHAAQCMRASALPALPGQTLADVMRAEIDRNPLLNQRLNLYNPAQFALAELRRIEQSPF